MTPSARCAARPVSGSGNSFALNVLGGDTDGLDRLADLAGTLLQKDVRLVADLADAAAVPGMR